MIHPRSYSRVGTRLHLPTPLAQDEFTIRGTWGCGYVCHHMTQLSHMRTRDSCGRKGQGRARVKGRLHRLQSCLLSQGGPQSSSYKYLLFVFPKSAHVEPTNRLDDPSVATQEGGRAWFVFAVKTHITYMRSLYLYLSSLGRGYNPSV